MVKTDKIKLVKVINGFDKIGQEFEVTNISDDGSITFRCGFGYGVMSFDEFEKHFEKIECQGWSDLKIEYDEFNGSMFKYKTNNKQTIVYKNGNRGYSRCMENDCFSLEKGIKICLAKIKVHEAKDELESLII